MLFESWSGRPCQSDSTSYGLMARQQSIRPSDRSVRLVRRPKEGQTCRRLPNRREWRKLSTTGLCRGSICSRPSLGARRSVFRRTPSATPRARERYHLRLRIIYCRTENGWDAKVVILLKRNRYSGSIEVFRTLGHSSCMALSWQGYLVLPDRCTRLWLRAKHFLEDEHGQDMVEYALLAGFVAVRKVGDKESRGKSGTGKSGTGYYFLK